MSMLIEYTTSTPQCSPWYVLRTPSGYSDLPLVPYGGPAVYELGSRSGSNDFLIALYCGETKSLHGRWKAYVSDGSHLHHLLCERNFYSSGNILYGRYVPCRSKAEAVSIERAILSSHAYMWNTKLNKQIKQKLMNADLDTSYAPYVLYLDPPSIMSSASSSSSSSASPAKPTKADLIKAREAVKLLEQSGLNSTLENSLRENLEKMKLPDHVPNDIDRDWDEEDLMDAEFWEHGVAIPEDIKVDTDNTKLVFQNNAAWAVAFNELEAKFERKATLLFKLKQLYAVKRKELNELKGKAASVNAIVAEANKIRKNEKKCGCGTSCSRGNCTCRAGGWTCAEECGCHLKGCLNPNSYANDKESREKLEAASDEYIAKSRAILVKKREEKSERSGLREEYIRALEKGYPL